MPGLSKLHSVSALDHFEFQKICEGVHSDLAKSGKKATYRGFDKHKISINIWALFTKVTLGRFPSDSLIKTFSSDLADL